ncbi:hypothetical protein ACFU5O_19665 [Streptomyces sp. NPDC057445]|uniref:hypothetical protein n=1 Tax=Streptomyces sp. NPDC057445 TaxID=3346136 RepID=UPI0036B61F9C
MLAETIFSAVSAAGLGIAAVMAYRKRFLSATRIAAYALVPLGLVLTGAVEWVAGTAFSPVAWAGVGVLGLAWVLFMTSRAVERRALGKAPQDTTRPGAVPPSSAPALGKASRKPGQAGRSKGGQGTAGQGEDFSDIEAILKKHGI